MSATEVDPWEQLDDETARAYQAFRLFRDAGPTRSLASSQAKRGTARGWSIRFRWADRARAWDAEAHRLEDARRLEAIRTMGDTHQQIARLMIAAGLRTLQEQPELTPHQAARLLDLGTRLQRAALTGEHLPAPAPTLVDVEDLSPLERIARELAGTA